MKTISRSIGWAFLLLCFSNFAAAQTASDRAKKGPAAAFADQVLDRLKSADFEGAFGMFYFPDGSAEFQKETDREAITAGLRELILNKLGGLESYSWIDTYSNDKLVSIKVQNGTPEIMDNVSAISVFTKATFGGFGDGYIVVGVHGAYGGDEKGITFIRFELPISNPQTSQITTDFSKFMMDIAAQQGKD